MAVSRIVVFLQENKTTDFYFASMAAWGAAVADQGPLLGTPPDFDQPHDRNAWVHYASGDYPAFPVQVDTDTVIPFYAYLAKEFVFGDHHFGAGSNSTSGHMLAVGGQTPDIQEPAVRWRPPDLEPALDLHFRRGRARHVGRVPGPERLPDEVLHQPQRGPRQRQRSPPELVHPDGCRRRAAGHQLRV